MRLSPPWSGILVLLCLPALADPPAGPSDAASAMFTLEDLYQRLVAGTVGAKRTGAFTEPSTGPGAVMHSLNDLMLKAPEVDASAATAADVVSGKVFWCLASGSWGKKTGTYAVPTTTTVTFNYLDSDTPSGDGSGGQPRSWEVLPGVTSVTVELWGAQGGGDYGGLGGYAKATVAVVPTETLYIFVGGWPSGTVGGFNGGGAGTLAGYMAPGGGGTDLRTSSGLTDWNNRLLAAGGGGGMGWPGIPGGGGGGLSGGDGASDGISDYFQKSLSSGGGGGTASAGGRGGMLVDVEDKIACVSSSGSLGTGGDGWGVCLNGGGGGGGWYGGGSGLIFHPTGGYSDTYSGSGGGSAGYNASAKMPDNTTPRPITNFWTSAGLIPVTAAWSSPG